VKALITGAGGFVGRNLIAHLRECGDEVTALDREVDVTDADAIGGAIGEVRPDAVYHLAALSHVGESWTEPDEYLRVNTIGTQQVVSACRDAGVGKVLVVGSAEQYGTVRPEDCPIAESTPMQPHSPYATSKVAAEYVALQAYLAEDVPTVRIRAFNHTGPFQSARFLVPALARRIADAERDDRDEIAVGSLEPVRDITDVADVVRAYRLLAEFGVPGQVYNVCSGTGVSVRKIAETLLAQARRPLRLRVNPDFVRPVDVPILVGSPAKLTRVTGWRPQIPLEETLTNLLVAARLEVGPSRSPA
jgi:GDP-4-dehydro-6-deoxy-D-mannose reductase